MIVLCKVNVKAVLDLIQTGTYNRWQMSTGINNNTELLAIFDNAPLIMLLVDIDRIIRRANNLALEKTHHEQNEALGMRSGELLRCIHAFDDPDGCGSGLNCQACVVRNTVMDTFETGQSHRQAGAILNLDSRDNPNEIHVLCSTTPLSINGEDLVLVCLQDVSDIKQTETDLRISEERYALAQRAANIGSWDWNILSGDLKWSDTIEPMFGFSEGGFGATYESFLECVHPEDREHLEISVNDAIEKDVDYDIEHRIIWPDGTVRWVSETGEVYRDESGQPVRMLGIVQDITDRKKVDKIKDDFIGLVSHELRSPLTVIIGAINTVLSEADQLTIEETNELLQDASIEAESLSHLIGNLLELSRSKAERLLIYPEPLNIRDIIEYVVETIARQSGENRFIQDIPDELPRVRADQLRAERIFHNLLENAIKYSQPESDIHISARQRNREVVISVRDSGEGISPADQKMLFEPFHRAFHHESAGITGTGLGLSVCKILVEANGGSIW